MLDTLSNRGDGTIFAFFVVRQGVMLAGFVWREGIPVFTFDALIPCVTNQRCFWVNLDFGCSKECQVMGCPFASEDAHNDVRRCVNQNLHF